MTRPVVLRLRFDARVANSILPGSCAFARGLLGRGEARIAESECVETASGTEGNKNATLDCDGRTAALARVVAAFSCRFRRFLCHFVCDP